MAQHSVSGTPEFKPGTSPGEILQEIITKNRLVAGVAGMSSKLVFDPMERQPAGASTRSRQTPSIGLVNRSDLMARHGSSKASFEPNGSTSGPQFDKVRVRRPPASLNFEL